MTSRAEEYRRYARQCLEIAPTLRDEEARATLLGFAQTWLRLAHLAQANRQIAELVVQIASHRVIVKHALEMGQRSEMAESLLDALQGSLRICEKHRIFLLSCSVNRPSMSLDRQGPDPSRERWPSRLVATAAEDCLRFRGNPHIVCGSPAIAEQSGFPKTR